METKCRSLTKILGWRLIAITIIIIFLITGSVSDAFKFGAID